MKNLFLVTGTTLAIASALVSCKPKNAGSAVSGDAAQKAYVAPGKYDGFYNSDLEVRIEQKNDKRSDINPAFI